MALLAVAGSAFLAGNDFFEEIVGVADAMLLLPPRPTLVGEVMGLGFGATPPLLDEAMLLLFFITPPFFFIILNRSAAIRSFSSSAFFSSSSFLASASSAFSASFALRTLIARSFSIISFPSSFSIPSAKNVLRIAPSGTPALIMPYCLECILTISSSSSTTFFSSTSFSFSAASAPSIRALRSATFSFASIANWAIWDLRRSFCSIRSRRLRCASVSPRLATTVPSALTDLSVADMTKFFIGSLFIVATWILCAT
mmetsp:Transcript_17059/g.35881  ORF Transcript_17059/g.35881 Transcript_17059/m.35881 type:complete len:256 (-) Transcript_17059:1045-1812(-)